MEQNKSAWKRPDSVPFPSVWSRFKGSKEIDGVIPTFWIQDVPEDQFDTVAEHMVTGFAKDEPLCIHSNYTSDMVSMREGRALWKTVLKDKVGLICYMENSDPNGQPIIAGMNVTHAKSKFDHDDQKLEGQSLSRIFETMKFLSNMKDAFGVIQQDEFLNALGLYVIPKFRGQGIGLELLKAREPMCKAVGIKASVTAFTATASQILAARAGFQDLSVISYSDLEKANPSLSYPGIENHTKNLKYMYILYK